MGATSLQTGSLWRFSKRHMADYRVGVIPRPQVPLAMAVAASSAFPPFLSPVQLALDASAFQAEDRGPLHHEPYVSKAVLSDGGVYDNLGLEPAWGRSGRLQGPDAAGRNSWGIRTNIADYELDDAMPCPFERTMELAEIRTRLGRMHRARRRRLVNWGYAVCDAALRRWVTPAPDKPNGCPYPDEEV